ncbi:RagB/SusD family nutrient uptake outer membrane protein [Chitinophaga varians]|uniref:RagB/SusD family nutrient uptake outer membrane protein n=1 Tax=Chitinophaga varians TaxID=2202339 RepID=UPI00165F9911|nr:RagB/SusD family nutrient uptake outer membrane protein [Chitinophaga varians]MBC9909816.1 RagB/SusD family nutrient uptake outer membrane protein [Chitinophaga varians]
MNKRFLIYSCLIALLPAFSCNKVLEVKTVSDITNASYWKSPGDVTGYLTGIYALLRGTVNDKNYFNTTYYMEDRSDAFIAGLEGGMSTAWQQNLNSANAPNWLNYYNIIYHCNLLLKNAPGINFPNSTDRDRAMAETYFIRAYTYFWLVRTWSDVPLMLEPVASSNQQQPSRAAATDIMAQLLKDIDAAIALFPEGAFVNKSRASKPAAFTLKADALLWKAKVLKGNDADLQDALTALQQVESTAGLTLLDNFASIFATNNKANAEIIFSVYFKKDERSDMYGSQLKPRDIFVQDAINKNDIAAAKNGARSQYMPSPKFESMFTDAADKRKNASFIKAIGPNNKLIGVFDNKFRGTKDTDWFYDADIVIYRFAEIFLLKAEVLAALGRVSDAVTALNRTRTRAGIGNYAGPMDKTSVEKEILNERFRELWLEQKRWPDLLRFHYAGTINVYTEVPNLNGKNVPLYFPIPKAQIDLNPNLKQTAGYQ